MKEQDLTLYPDRLAGSLCLYRLNLAEGYLDIPDQCIAFSLPGSSREKFWGDVIGTARRGHAEHSMDLQIKSPKNSPHEVVPHH